MCAFFTLTDTRFTNVGRMAVTEATAMIRGGAVHDAGLIVLIMAALTGLKSFLVGGMNVALSDVTTNTEHATQNMQYWHVHLALGIAYFWPCGFLMLGKVKLSCTTNRATGVSVCDSDVA